MLGLECYKIKFGYYLIGNRKSMIVFEGEDGWIEDIIFGRNV